MPSKNNNLKHASPNLAEAKKGAQIAVLLVPTTQPEA
jgi:uncharacterized membrane protein YgcG